ncbi:MAG: hypothetical protein F6K44_27075 [Moorea sp. SIO3E2]|nr:hypothetical protein [Moorena sp. SIO3E2]
MSVPEDVSEHVTDSSSVSISCSSCHICSSVSQEEEEEENVGTAKAQAFQLALTGTPSC